MSTPNQAASMKARLGMSFTLECKDKDGNVLKRIDVAGSAPLSSLGLSVEQAQELIKEQGNVLGNHK